MAIIATDKGGGSVPAPAGSHIARCINVIDIGSQKSTFEGEERTRRKVRIAFELPQELHVFDEAKGEEPYVVSKEYTLSTGAKSNLRRDLESWRGKPFSAEEIKAFDVSKLLNAVAVVTIVHEPKKDGTGDYAKITSVTKPLKGTVCPDRVLPLLEYSVDMGKNDVFKSLPEWLQKKCLACEEWIEYPANADPTPAEKDVPAPEDDDSVPF